MGNAQPRVMQNIAERLKARRWLWSSVAAAGLISVGGLAVWASWPRDNFVEPACTPPAPNAEQVGCVATVPIKDVNIGITSNIGLSRDGTRLLLAGAPPHDETKVVLQAFEIAERREVWRVPVEGLGFYHQLAVSGKDDKVAVWGSEPRVRIVDMQSGKTTAELASEVAYVRHYIEVSFSDDNVGIVTGFAGGRRILTLSDPTSEPAIAPGFENMEGRCSGPVGQSNSGHIRSRDGKLTVILLKRLGSPIWIDRYSPSSVLADAVCGAKYVLVLDHPRDLRGATADFMSFSPDGRKLAIVYIDQAVGRPTRTFIAVWDMATMYPRHLLTFPMDGIVGYRIAWSADGRRLAAVRSNAEGADARIYAIPAEYAAETAPAL